MNEYDFYIRILAPHLRCKNQDILVEKKNNRSHTTTIIPGSIAHALYRYDMDEEKRLFMPFFNKTHNREQNQGAIATPTGLLRFCDYIILANKKDKLFVILVEMKSGGNADAVKQLEATERFMEYIRLSAERIKDENGCENFSYRNFHVKKVILKPSIASKPGTNKVKSFPIDWNEDLIYLPSNTLPLMQLCL